MKPVHNCEKRTRTRASWSASSSGTRIRKSGFLVLWRNTRIPSSAPAAPPSIEQQPKLRDAPPAPLSEALVAPEGEEAEEIDTQRAERKHKQRHGALQGGDAEIVAPGGASVKRGHEFLLAISPDFVYNRKKRKRSRNDGDRAAV